MVSANATALTKQLLATTLSLLLVMGRMPLVAAAQQTGPSGYAGQGVPLSAEELQQLVAPIALYPDSLVAQILGATTFPDQVAAAASWLQQNSNLTGTALMKSVDAKPWDPSVKALTQFPSVLANLATNLTWTSSLGEAYNTQSAAVMSAVQFLRAKALAAGNLKTGQQPTVVQESLETIAALKFGKSASGICACTEPCGSRRCSLRYPNYVLRGPAPLDPRRARIPGRHRRGRSDQRGIRRRYSSWNCGWHGTTTVVYRGGAYYGNPAWHGGYYGSSKSVYGPNGAAHYSSGYNPSTGTVARGGTVSNGYGSVSAGQAYNPRTGASASTVQGSNANGSWGASTVSKNGNTAYGQHQTTSQGTTGQVHTTNGGSAYGATGKNGNTAAVGQTANGNKYATANGNTYSNTGNGWSGNSNNTQKSGSSSYSSQPNNSQKSSSSSSSNSTQKSSASGWGQQERAAGHRPSAAGAEAGKPSRRVLAVRQARAVVAAGAAAAAPPRVALASLDQLRDLISH